MLLIENFILLLKSNKELYMNIIRIVIDFLLSIFKSRIKTSDSTMNEPIARVLEEKPSVVAVITSDIPLEKPKEVNPMSTIEQLGQLTNLLTDFTAKTGIPINQELIPLGHPNRPGTKLSKFQAIVIHYTANENPGATDQVNAKYFRSGAEKGPVWDATKKSIITDWIELKSVKEQKVTDGSIQIVGTQFRYG